MTESQACLIYCKPDLAESIRLNAENAIEVTCSTEYESLRLLDDKHKSGKFKLLYTTDCSTMRGFDYRARNYGISLVIADSFETERDFH